MGCVNARPRCSDPGVRDPGVLFRHVTATLRSASQLASIALRTAPQLTRSITTIPAHRSARIPASQGGPIRCKHQLWRNTSNHAARMLPIVCRLKVIVRKKYKTLSTRFCHASIPERIPSCSSCGKYQGLPQEHELFPRGTR
jgi:hypothetical protein